MFLGMCSICYANVSADYIKNGVQKLQASLDVGQYTSNMKTILSLLNDDKFNDITTHVNTQLENNNLTNLNDYNLIIGLTKSSSRNAILRLYFFNNSAPNNTSLDFASALIVSSNYDISHFNKKNNNTDPIYMIVISIPSQNLTTLDTITYNPITTSTSIYDDFYFNGTSFLVNGTVITSPNLVGYGLPSIYYNNSPYILKNINENVTPSTPTPTATPTPTPIITPTPTSAPIGKDYSGQLTEIKDTISGEGKAIRDNDNKNTEQIVNAISGEGQAIRDSITDYDEELADDTISDFISNMQDSISGELSNSQILGALEEVESGFIDLISGQASDFIVSWDDVYYNGVNLIPSGDINFSAFCRENSAFANVKEKLNIILSALCGIALIKYLYNLLLATLGIDNPYLYDKVKDAHVNSSTANVRVTAKVPYTSYDKNGNLNGWGRDEK